MYRLKFILLAFILVCCTTDDNEIPLSIEPIFVDNPEKSLLIDIIYVLPAVSENQITNRINEDKFIRILNGNFFNRHDIGFILGDIRTINNDELYDLRDDVNEEQYVFLEETKKSYKKDRMNVYIIKRSNTMGIAGIGSGLRALITDEHVYTSTAPHEIGHALGLFHISETGNVMTETKSHPRTSFNTNQVNWMKLRIDRINL